MSKFVMSNNCHDKLDINDRHVLFVSAKKSKIHFWLRFDLGKLKIGPRISSKKAFKGDFYHFLHKLHKQVCKCNVGVEKILF